MFRFVALLLLSVGCGSGESEGTNQTSSSSTTSSTTGTTTSSTSMTTSVTTTTGTTSTTSTSTSTTTTKTNGIKEWNFLVFINGDNDLEFYVTNDLNELEGSGSGEHVNVLAQADRHAEYYQGDGDWDDTRRYYVTYDEVPNEVTSEVVEYMGEIDMGDPESLSDFLFWAAEEYPAEHTALIMWNHGDGWSLKPGSNTGGPSEFISWDEGDNNWMSIVEGDLNAGLQDYVDVHGKLDIIGFDACNMGFWEVAHSLRDYADYMTASQTVVYMEGYQYDYTIDAIHENGSISPVEVADKLVWPAAELNGETAQAVTNLAMMDELAVTIDLLAVDVLNEMDTMGEAFLDARDDARSAHGGSWGDYYLDLGDLADQLADRPESVLSTHGQNIRDALDQSMESNYTNPPFLYLGGLNIYTDLRNVYLETYAGDGEATWAEETSWDEMLHELADL